MKIEIDIVKRMFFVGGSKDGMTMIYASDVFPPEYSFVRFKYDGFVLSPSLESDYVSSISTGSDIERYVLFAVTGYYRETGIYVEASLVPKLKECLGRAEDTTLTNFFNCVNKILKRREKDEDRKA